MKDIDIEDKLHLWFELSYAQYLTIPRLVLQSMPVKWKNKLAELLFELDDTVDWRPGDGRYWVKLRDGKGRYCADPLSNYRYGNIDHLMKKKDDNE